MLGRFSTVLQNAVDALAPPVPLPQDFAYHWKRLMKHYLDVTSSQQPPLPVELTNIPSHLDQLLRLLKEEEEKGESGSGLGSGEGTCLDYLVEHSILDLLATLAATDDPPGMRKCVLTFVSSLLVRPVAPTLFSLPSVLQPIQRLISVCDGTTPGPWESDEVQLILSLSALLSQAPHLLPIFTPSAAPTPVPSQVEKLRRGSWSSGSECSDMTGRSSTSSVTNPLLCPPPTVSSIALPSTPRYKLVPPEDKGEWESEDSRSLATEPPQYDSCCFPLVDSLLSYLDSPDADVRVKACQALMLLVSVPDEKVVRSLTQDSSACTRLASRLARLYTQIPDDTHPAHVEDLTVSWGLDVPLSPCISCEGCRQLTAFLSWFDFCDQVVRECGDSIMTESLCGALVDLFMKEVWTVDSLERVLDLSLLTKCLTVASSPSLVSALCSWLIGEVEMEEIEREERTVVGPIFHRLLSNWTHDDSQVILETIRLFQVLLDKGDEECFNSLIIIYLESSTSPVNDSIQICEDGERLPNGKVELKETEILSAPCIEEEHPISQTNNQVSLNRDSSDTPNNQTVDDLIYSLLSVVPRGLQSGGESSGYEQYVAESRRVCTELLHLSPGRLRPLDSEKSASDASSKSAHYPGPFLSTLSSSIAQMLHQEYRVMLELTSIVSRLAADPDGRVAGQVLREEGCVGEALRSLANSLTPLITSHLDHPRLLADTRYALLSAPTPYTPQQFEWSAAFECVVVLEELCKELAAIAKVRLTIASASQQYKCMSC